MPRLGCLTDGATVLADDRTTWASARCQGRRRETGVAVGCAVRDTQTMHVRSISAGDHPAVIALALRAWEPVFESFRLVLGAERYARVFPDWRRSQAEAVDAAITTHPTWVVEDVVGDGGERVVGFVSVVFDDAERSGEIHMIATDPDAQRRGAGRMLVAVAEREMRQRGATLAVIATGGDPGHAPARALYETAGYHPFPQVWYSKLL